MGNSHTDLTPAPLPEEIYLALKGKSYEKKNINYGENFKIIKEKKKSTLFAIKIDDFFLEEEFYEYLYNLKLRKSSNIQLKNFVSVEGIFVKDKNLFCSQKFLVYSKFQYFSESLSSIIKRIQNGQCKMFSSNQILSMIFTISETLMKLENFNIFHGNIRPETILFDEFGEIKLTDSCFMLKENSYHNYLFGKYEKIYVCPSVLKQLKLLNIKPKINYEKSNVFSLGLTVLEALTFCDINHIYDFTNHEIIPYKLEQFIKKATAKYDEQIGLLLKGMLEMKKSGRYGYKEIMEYSEKIGFDNTIQYSFRFREEKMVKSRAHTTELEKSKISMAETGYDSKNLIMSRDTNY